MMTFKTKRLLLRPWLESDAADLYRAARDPRIGPVAGWPSHTSEENSLEIIQTVLSTPNTYAVIDPESHVAIGCVGLMVGSASNFSLPENQGEIGYWIDVPYWGRGLIPEAVDCIVDYAFASLGLSDLFCGYFEGNDKSRRVQEKCGFVFDHTKKDFPCSMTNDIRTEHVTRLSREAWETRKTLSKPKT